MDFLELAKERYSVRKFEEKEVSQEQIDYILKVAQVAPTAANYQPQRILVLQEKEDLALVKQCTKFHFDAPLCFLICYDEESSWKRNMDGKDSGEVDASIITTHMMLTVTQLGLGSTWVGSFDTQKVKELFSLPKQYIPVALLPVGYPHKKSVPHGLHEKRLPLSETVFYHRYK